MLETNETFFHTGRTAHSVRREFMSWMTTAWIGAGCVLAAREHAWLRAAQMTEGKVVEMVRSRSSKGRGTYAPRVRFADQRGATHEFVRGYSSSPPDFVVGEKITVAYDPVSFQGRIVTFGQRFGFAAILAVLGGALFALAAAFIMGRQFVPQIYLR